MRLQGAAQFAADCEAVLVLLQPYTPRPAAHFREVCDAARLLTLQHDRVRQAIYLLCWSQLHASAGVLTHAEGLRRHPQNELQMRLTISSCAAAGHSVEGGAGCVRAARHASSTRCGRESPEQ